MKISIHGFYADLNGVNGPPNTLYYVTGINTQARVVECQTQAAGRVTQVPFHHFRHFQMRPELKTWNEGTQHELPLHIRQEFGLEVTGELLDALLHHPRRGELLAACEAAGLPLPRVPDGETSALRGRLPMPGSPWRRWMQMNLQQQINQLQMQQRALENHEEHILKFE